MSFAGLHRLRPSITVNKMGKGKGFLACLNLGLSPARENILHRGGMVRQTGSKWIRAGWCSTG
jgi:hypothetical protein